MQSDKELLAMLTQYLGGKTWFVTWSPNLPAFKVTCNGVRKAIQAELVNKPEPKPDEKGVMRRPSVIALDCNEGVLLFSSSGVRHVTRTLDGVTINMPWGNVVFKEVINQ